MSKHWKPRSIEGGRSSQRLRGQWPQRLKRKRIRLTAGELRLVLLGGLFAGLGTGFAMSTEGAGPASPAPRLTSEIPDRWSESRQSRRILAVQEGSPWGAAAPDTARPKIVKAGLVRVIDGDTFEVDGERIRIADIDTPEVNGRCAHESELAARATGRMRDLLHQGPFDLNPIARDEDRYGRKLRIVTRDGRSLGDILVAEGLARTWSGRREPWC